MLLVRYGDNSLTQLTIPLKEVKFAYSDYNHCLPNISRTFLAY